MQDIQKQELSTESEWLLGGGGGKPGSKDEKYVAEKTAHVHSESVKQHQVSGSDHRAQSAERQSPKKKKKKKKGRG